MRTVIGKARLPLCCSSNRRKKSIGCLGPPCFVYFSLIHPSAYCTEDIIASVHPRKKMVFCYAFPSDLSPIKWVYWAIRENLILSNELIKVELPQWKIWKDDVSSVSPSLSRTLPPMQHHSFFRNLNFVCWTMDGFPSAMNLFGALEAGRQKWACKKRAGGWIASNSKKFHKIIWFLIYW